MAAQNHDTDCNAVNRRTICRRSVGQITPGYSKKEQTGAASVIILLVLRSELNDSSHFEQASTKGMRVTISGRQRGF